jgi:hypothetical protein
MNWKGRVIKLPWRSLRHCPGILQDGPKVASLGTERRTWVISTPTSHLGDPVFKPRLGFRLFWLRSCEFPQFLQANIVIVPLTRPRPLPFISFHRFSWLIHLHIIWWCPEVLSSYPGPFSCFVVYLTTLPAVHTSVRSRISNQSAATFAILIHFFQNGNLLLMNWVCSGDCTVQRSISH